MEYIIGTRGSALALAQTELVRQTLESRYPEHRFSVRVIQTAGDRILNQSLRQIGTKGIFVQEIEQQLLSGEIQLAVHSLKDMPCEGTEGLCFSRFWVREDCRDALILRTAPTLEALPPHAVIGTGSARRAAQLLALRPDLRVVDIRGNLQTRLRRMEEQALDGIVLAAAGLKRIHLEEVITHYFTPDEMLCAPAQGILGIQLRESDTALRAMVDSCCDPDADAAGRAERAFLTRMGGGCHIPLGACCTPAGEGQYRLRAVYQDEAAGSLLRTEAVGTEPEALAETAAADLLGRLARTAVWVPKIGAAPSPLAAGLRKQGVAVREQTVGQICSLPFAVEPDKLARLSWLVFTSANGLRGFFSRLEETGADSHALLASCRFAVIGHQTAVHLSEYGFVPDFVPSAANSEHFWPEFAARLTAGDSILYCTGTDSHLPKGTALPCPAEELAVYENRAVTPENPVPIPLWGEATAFFTCASSVRRFLTLWPEDQLTQWKLEGTALSIGPKTSAALRRAGVQHILEAPVPSYQSLQEAYRSVHSSADK